MNSLEKAAADYRLGLQLGMHCVAGEIEWADCQIALCEVHPYDLIDLSLMANQQS
ncbi:MAG: hypothetical protein AB4050_12950 [Synechococcus sp.]